MGNSEGSLPICCPRRPRPLARKEGKEHEEGQEEQRAGLSFSAIARRIGKDRTTVAKDVRARRYRIGKGASPSNLRTEEKPEARAPQ